MARPVVDFGKGLLLGYNKDTIKEFLLKNKRVVLVALAVVLLALLFFIKTKSEWTNEEMASAGLVSGDEILGDVLSKDTDKDGILDWEEGLWGTDPTKGDTNDDGVSDKEEIARMKAERGTTSGEPASADGSGGASEENLTQTDKFARELFTTIAALNQSGEIDENTVEELTNSLATQIQNPVQRKVFTISDLKISSDSSKEAITVYDKATDKIFLNKYPFDEQVANTLQKFVEADESTATSVLVELDPTLKNLSEIIADMQELAVPSILANFHLDITNNLEKILENLNDIQNFESDPLAAIGAVNEYLKNQEQLNNVVIVIANTIVDRLR